MKDVKKLTTNLIAHRGMHSSKITENTLEAFILAMKHNYIIEFDVHLLKDNNIIVYHDDNLQRLAHLNQKIKNLKVSNLKKVHLPNNAKIPMLAEVLQLINGKVPIIIELKCDNRVGKLEKELVKYLDNYNGVFAVKSFNPLSVMWFKKHRPNYIRGLLLSGKEKLRNKIMRTNFIFNLCKPDFLSFNYLLYKHKLMNKKIIKLAWTINSLEKYQKYKEYYDNLICENILDEVHKI